MRRSGESVLRGACLAAAELIGMLGEAVGLEDDLSKGAQQIPNLEHYQRLLWSDFRTLESRLFLRIPCRTQLIYIKVEHQPIFKPPDPQ